MTDRDIAEACGWKDRSPMLERYLGPDSSGLAQRMRERVAESGDGFRTILVPKRVEEAKR